MLNWMVLNWISMITRKKNATSQLYHYVAAAVELDGKKVLEVGSVRGGGASYVARVLQQPNNSPPASRLGGFD